MIVKHPVTGEEVQAAVYAFIYSFRDKNRGSGEGRAVRTIFGESCEIEEATLRMVEKWLLEQYPEWGLVFVKNVIPLADIPPLNIVFEDID